jgi:hypothetical protein
MQGSNPPDTVAEISMTLHVALFLIPRLWFQAETGFAAGPEKIITLLFY